MSPTAPWSHPWKAGKGKIITCGAFFSSSSKTTITSLCVYLSVCVFPTRDCVYVYRLDTVRNFFTERVVKFWNTLPREVMESPSLEVLKESSDAALTATIWLTR